MADKVIQYLYSIRGKAIYYKGDDKGQNNKRDSRGKVQLFIYASNILFINNSVDRKSS